MIWARRFLPVPTSALKVDPAISAQSPKGYSDRDLKEIAATVPAVYDQIADGMTEKDLLVLRSSADPEERQVGETYAQLFCDLPSSNPLAAGYDGTDLVVDKGNHRIRAAREIGVPVLPVWVSAPSEAQLDRVEDACARRIEREGASAYRDAHLAHEKTILFERNGSRGSALVESREWERHMPERER